VASSVEFAAAGRAIDPVSASRILQAQVVLVNVGFVSVGRAWLRS